MLLNRPGNVEFKAARRCARSMLSVQAAAVSGQPAKKESSPRGRFDRGAATLTVRTR
jgi:hypothetical protein